MGLGEGKAFLGLCVRRLVPETFPRIWKPSSALCLCPFSKRLQSWEDMSKNRERQGDRTRIVFSFQLPIIIFTNCLQGSQGVSDQVNPPRNPHGTPEFDTLSSQNEALRSKGPALLADQGRER